MAHRHVPQFSPMPAGAAKTGENEAASVLFDQFCAANTFHGIMGAFHGLCDALEERPVPHQLFYKQLKPKLNTWKAQSLWTKLDKRAGHREYKRSGACTNTCALIIGCGPCGLRTAIEIALLGGKAVVVEKRDRFSRNNVLHLWPFLIHDLKALGAKKFFGKFCAGSIDHISIRTLQCILLKTALLVGVEVHSGVSYEDLIEPSEANEGWKIKVSPADHPVSQYHFDVLIGADGKRNTLAGFRRKEFRGKLAIAITANFINKNTQAEARVEEISGVAFIFNQKFFKDLNHQTGIDLENIVYYKDETHYFVMTAKKHSLLDKGVLKQDYDSTETLLSPANVNQKNLEDYARQAADFSTKLQLPSLDFAHNQYGQPDVSMFDFTSIYASEHASRVIERKGSKLLVALVGDSLLEPFWPTGSGCARGFFGAFDAAWMVRSWASGKKTPLEVMSERESIYQLLSQTTPENISKNFHTYTIDPISRYPNLNSHFFQPHQMKNQYDGEDVAYLNEIVQVSVQKRNQYEWMRDSHHLLKWFQRNLEPYRNIVRVMDLTKSWRTGIALCCLIHRFRPKLIPIDVYNLDPNNVLQNNQLAFDIAEKDLGIEPLLTGQDMVDADVPDKFQMVSYLSRFFSMFRKESTQTEVSKHKSESREAHAKQRSKMRRMRHARDEFDYQEDKERRYEREGANVRRKRKPLHVYGITKRRVKEMSSEKKYEGKDAGRKFYKDSDLAAYQSGAGKVSEVAKDLAIKFSGKGDTETKKATSTKPKGFVVGLSYQAEMCYFCKEPVYLMERYTAEGLYFHQSCFQCHFCGVNLRLATYSMERASDSRAKFFCPQHHGFKQKHRRPHRRQADKHPLASKFDLPPPERPNERIEYVTESEVEESELDQTSHNLSSSMLDLNESDSDSSTEDETDSIYEGNLSDGEVSWAQLATANKAIRKCGRARREWGSSEDSDTETETAGASDADYETETETEKEEENDTGTLKRKPKDFGKSHLLAPQPPPVKEIKPSPTSQELMKNRMSFFDAPAAPVSIDPFAFFGMKKTPDPAASQEEKLKEEGENQEGEGDSKEDTDTKTEEDTNEDATPVVKRKSKHHIVGDVSFEMAAEMHDTVSLVDLDDDSSSEENDDDVDYFTDSDEFMADNPEQEIASGESLSSDELYGDEDDRSKPSESEETSDSVVPDFEQRSSECTPDPDEILDGSSSTTSEHDQKAEVGDVIAPQAEAAVAPAPPKLTVNTAIATPKDADQYGTDDSLSVTSPTSPSVTSPLSPSSSDNSWPSPRKPRSILRKRTMPGEVISAKIRAIREIPEIPPIVPSSLDEDIPMIDTDEPSVIPAVKVGKPKVVEVSSKIKRSTAVKVKGPPEVKYRAPQEKVSPEKEAQSTPDVPKADPEGFVEIVSPVDMQASEGNELTGEKMLSRETTPGFEEIDSMVQENDDTTSPQASASPVCSENAIVVQKLIAEAIADETEALLPAETEASLSTEAQLAITPETTSVKEVEEDGIPLTEISSPEDNRTCRETSQQDFTSDGVVEQEKEDLRCTDVRKEDVPQNANGSDQAAENKPFESVDVSTEETAANDGSDSLDITVSRIDPASRDEIIVDKEESQEEQSGVEQEQDETNKVSDKCEADDPPELDSSFLDESYTTCPGSLQTSRRDSGAMELSQVEENQDSPTVAGIERMADNLVSVVVEEAIIEAKELQREAADEEANEDRDIESVDGVGQSAMKDVGLGLPLQSSSSGSSSAHSNLAGESSDMGASPALSPQGVKTPPKATIDEFDDLGTLSNATSLSSVRRDSADLVSLDSDADKGKLESPVSGDKVLLEDSREESFVSCPGTLHTSTTEASVDISKEHSLINSVMEKELIEEDKEEDLETISETAIVPDSLPVVEGAPVAGMSSLEAPTESSPEATTPMSSDAQEDTDNLTTASTEDTLTVGAAVEYATGDSLDESECEIASPSQEKQKSRESSPREEIPETLPEDSGNADTEIGTVDGNLSVQEHEAESNAEVATEEKEKEETVETNEEKEEKSNAEEQMPTDQPEIASDSKPEPILEAGPSTVIPVAEELKVEESQNQTPTKEKQGTPERRERDVRSRSPKQGKVHDKEKSLLRRLDRLVIGERDASARLSCPNIDERYGHLLRSHQGKARVSSGLAQELNGGHSASAENLKFLYGKEKTPEKVDKSKRATVADPSSVQPELVAEPKEEIRPEEAKQENKENEEKKEKPMTTPERRKTVLRARISARDVISAKRKFFCEPPRPVQIDPKAIFSQIPMAQRNSEDNPKYGWSQSMEAAVSVSPTTAMPRSNSASGDSDFTLISSQLPKQEKAEDAAVVNGVPEKAELSVDVVGHRSDSSSVSPNPSMSLSSDTASNPSPVVLRREKKSSDRSTSRSTSRSDSPKTTTLERKQDEQQKRKSFLAKILPSKKKDKAEGEKKGDRKGRADDKSKRSSASKRRKSAESRKAEKERANIPVGYILREVGPMGAYLKRPRHPRGRAKPVTIQERIEAVAPAPGPYRRETPPRATIDELEHESDTVSLSSSKTASEKELLRERRKQKQLLERQRKAEERKRLRKAQEIQRLLEEVGQKQKIVEQRGVAIEKKLRQNASHGVPEEAHLMEQWFNLVHEKNVLARYESELMIRARELELQDRHSRLERQLRELVSRDTADRTEADEAEEQKILKELVDIVEQRDALVSLLEEDRVREREVDEELKQVMSRIGYELSPILYLKSLSLSSVNMDPIDLGE